MQDTNCIIKCSTNWNFNFSKYLTIINFLSNLMNYTTRSLKCIKPGFFLRVFTFKLRILSNQSRVTVIDLIRLANLLWKNSHISMQGNKQICTPERVYCVCIVYFRRIILNIVYSFRKALTMFNNFYATTI